MQVYSAWMEKSVLIRPSPRPVPPIEQGQHLLHPAAGHGVLLRVEGLQGAAQVGLHAGSEDALGRVAGGHVHVGEGGGARGKHLQHGQLHADPKVLLREPVLHGEDGVEQPLIEGQIAPQAPQKAHARVGVAVDEARQQELAGHVLRFVVGLPGLLRAHVVDPVAVDAQVPVPDAGEGPVFPNQDVPVCQQSLHMFLLLEEWIKACRFSCKKSGAKELHLGSMVCMAVPIIPYKFLFFRRFFSLSKEKKRQIKTRYSFFSSGLAACSLACSF